MTGDRLKRWVKASHSLASFEPYMVISVQALGMFDVDLAMQNGAWKQRGGMADPRWSGLSWLWVLGAYEIVRSLEQRLRPERGGSRHQAAQELKLRYERVRIPLAKFEAPNRFPEDFGIALPALNQETGELPWQVGPGTFVSRSELADALLEFLESLRN